MKDKQIKYLLTLKRRFESIRHDQYIFSEKNPVDRQISSENQLLQLYQFINFSLQSIEFKILETVNMSNKKSKNENNNIQLRYEIDEGNNTQNQTKMLDNQQQIDSLNSTQTVLDNSNLRDIDMKTSEKLKQIQFNKDQHHQDYIEQHNANIGQFQQIIKNDGKIRKKIVEPFQSKFSNQTHQTEKSVQQEIIIKNELKFETDPLKNGDSNSKRILKLEEKNDQISNIIQFDQQQTQCVLQNNINQNLLGNQKSSKQQVNNWYANDRQNFIDERNNQNLFSDIPSFLSSLRQKQDSNVEIKQLFTDEKEEQLKIYDSQTKYIPNQNVQKIFKFQNCDRNSTIKKDEKLYFDENDDQTGIDQYLNFETPKKNTNDYFEESEIQERYVISNTSKKFIVESSIKNAFEKQAENNNTQNNIEEEVNEIKAKNLIRIRRFNNLKQLTNSNECKTVKKLPNIINTIDHSDQTMKYRFCELTTEKKRQSDMQQYSDDKTETKQYKSIISNKKISPSDPLEVIIDASNKKISKKLLYKQDEDFRSYVRGPYNFYSEELKKKAIKDYHKYKDIKKAAELNEVKVKNLKRWIAVGHKRKEGTQLIKHFKFNKQILQIKGGGRKKEDPDMEEKVYEWLCDQYYCQKQSISRNQIREQALGFSNKKDKFKASKGWLEKFFVRYNCKFMSQQDKVNAENEEEEDENNSIEFNEDIEQIDDIEQIEDIE